MADAQTMGLFERANEVAVGGTGGMQVLATFSACRHYRYTLHRTLQRLLIRPRAMTWIMLNPSTADETTDDATIRRCIGFAKAWGFDALTVVNAYAWRSTDPNGLWSSECSEAGGPVGADNDAAIVTACTGADMVVCAWGRHLRPDRREQLAHLLRGVKLTALATNSDGSPSHPLRLPSSLVPRPFTLLTMEEMR